MAPAEVWRGDQLIETIPKGETRIVETKSGQRLRIRGKKYGAGVRNQDEDEDYEDNIPMDYEMEYDDIRVIGR